MLQTLVHYSFHFLVPGLIAFVFYREQWQRAWLILLLTMLVDLDHLLADPIFDPNRCSFGFHPLHSYWALAIYIAMLFFKKTRLVAIGLVLHLLTDFMDCVWNGAFKQLELPDIIDDGMAHFLEW